MAVAHFILAHIVRDLLSPCNTSLKFVGVMAFSLSLSQDLSNTLHWSWAWCKKPILYIYIDSWLICLNRKLGTPKKAYAYPACSIRFDNFPCKPFTKPWIHPWSTLPSTAWAEWQPVPWLVRCQMSPQLADCMATFGGWRIPGTHEGVSLHSFLGVGCAARLWAVSGMYAPFMLISMWEN